MSDRPDDTRLTADLAALAPFVDMTASLALFERERRQPHGRRPSRILLPAAAVVLVVGAVAIWALARTDAEPTGPISTIPPATTETEVSSTVAPTTVSPTTVSPTTVVPTTGPLADVPSGLANWPARSAEPAPIDGVPRLLPTIPVGDATRATRIEGSTDNRSMNDYVQSWYSGDGEGYVTITSHVGQAPSTPDGMGEPIDTDGWATNWNDARLVQVNPELRYVELASDDGFVRVEASGLTEAQLVEIARSLERRPSPGPGWNAPGLPATFLAFGESGDPLASYRHLLWSTDDGDLVAELLVYSSNANLLTTGWSEGLTAEVIDLNGAAAVVPTGQGRVAIAWALPGGGHALFGFTGDRADAEAIVRSLAAVDQATWESATELPLPGRDGCESLFC